MGPLSCENCCHNPLQLGAVGTAFGWCTRHRLLLLQAHATTCGQLLRKDLLAASAAKEQARHVRDYPAKGVYLVAAPKVEAVGQGFVEKPNGHTPDDAVVEEVLDYGALDSKIATMAALRRVPGARAEVAMLSLSRGYFASRMAQGGSWTDGLHLLRWTLDRLDHDPRPAATDIRGPIARSLERTIDVARWTIVAFRLAFISDVGSAAEREHDPAGGLAGLANAAVTGAPGTDPKALLAWLGRTKLRWSSALTHGRYGELSEKLHREQETTPAVRRVRAKLRRTAA